MMVWSGCVFVVVFVRFVGGAIFCGGVVVSLWFCVFGCVFVVVLLRRKALEKRGVDKCWRRAL